MKPPASLGEQLERTRALLDYMLPMVRQQHTTLYMLDQLRGLADVLELGMRAVRGYIITQTSPAVAAVGAVAAGEHQPAASLLFGEVTEKPGLTPSGAWLVRTVAGVQVAHWTPVGVGDDPGEVSTACGQRFVPARVLAGLPVLEAPCPRCERCEQTVDGSTGGSSPAPRGGSAQRWTPTTAPGADRSDDDDGLAPGGPGGAS